MYKTFFGVAVLFLCFQLACNDSDLQKVSKSMLVLGTAVSELQTDVIAANTQGLMSDQDTKAVLVVCTKISATGKQIDAVLRSITQLDPVSRGNVIALLTTVSQTIDPTQLEFIAGIKDPATKQTVEGAFIVARTTISGLQIVLASSGGK